MKVSDRFLYDSFLEKNFYQKVISQYYPIQHYDMYYQNHFDRINFYNQLTLNLDPYANTLQRYFNLQTSTIYSFNDSIYNFLSLQYSNYSSILSSNKLNIITQSILETAYDPMYFIPTLHRNDSAKYVEKEISKLKFFSNDERNYILAGAGNISNANNAIPDYELTRKAQKLIKEFIPSILLQNLSLDKLKEIVMIIISIISIYYANQAHQDAILSHQDAIQSHQDNMTIQNQNDRIIELLKENNEINKVLLKKQIQNNKLLEERLK